VAPYRPEEMVALVMFRDGFACNAAIPTRATDLQRGRHLLTPGISALTAQKFGGLEGIRTPDLLNAVSWVNHRQESTGVVLSWDGTLGLVDWSTSAHRSPPDRLSSFSRTQRQDAVCAKAHRQSAPVTEANWCRP